MDHVGGVEFMPDEYVDITETFEIKRQMLACHESQLKAMGSLASADILEMIHVQSRFRGFAAGCKYAEGFGRLAGWQRGVARRLLP
jgi:LmbE family N-acetylglucosaminyl deacetylase